MQTDHGEGPRERARQRPPGDLSDAELLALLLGTGSRGESVEQLAVAVLAEHGGLRGVARAGVGALCARPGVGEVKGLRVVAAVELGRRVAAEPAALGWLPDSRAVHAWAQGTLTALEHEELWLLALDGQNRMRAARRVAVGGLHGLHVSVRDPLRIALREGASAFVLVHNHPSGDPSPSREDLHFTEQVAAAAELLATPLVDHVVVVPAGYRSLLDDGLLAVSPSGPRRVSRRG